MFLDFCWGIYDFTVAPRIQKEEESETAGGERLAGSLLPGETFTEANVFVESNPRMVTFANGDRLAVWQDEVSTKADDDRTSLFYRYYDAVAGSWGEPSVLFENGAFNGAPVLATDGEKAYLVWQRASRPLGTSGGHRWLDCLP